MSILQPSNCDRATIYAIAWDIVKRNLDTSADPLSAQQVAAMVAQAASRIVVDGGGPIPPDETPSKD